MLFSKPNGYLGATVDLTGKVGGAVTNDAVVHYNVSFAFVQDDWVRVTGIVEQEFEGVNMFSAARIVPRLSARTIG